MNNFPTSIDSLLFTPFCGDILTPEEQVIEEKFRHIYPNSIMLGAPYGIERTEVDELNAWLVGWCDKPKYL